MSVRWIGLARPRGKAPFCKHRFTREAVRALGAAGFLCMAAAMNFALYPNALAAALSGEQSIVGFVPEEPAGNMLSDQEPTVLDEEDVRLLAATVWGEARSEGEDGMRAVAHVMVNRIGERFGGDLATVILSPKQFSVWNRNDPNRRLVARLAHDPSGVATDPEWLVADRIAREVLGGQSVDPTGGALFYHTRAVRPRWARAGQGRQVIGQHIFYADVPDPGRRRTPQTIDVAQYLGLSLSSNDPPPPPGDAANEPIDVNAAATPTINGAPYTAAASADTAAMATLSAP